MYIACSFVVIVILDKQMEGRRMKNQEVHPCTIAINKMQKNKAKKSRSDALSWLATKFPKAFNNNDRIAPLEIGVREKIMAYAEEAEAVGISRSKLRQALVLFTRRLDYLICLKAREMRIDLQGNFVGEVTEEEAERASAKIKKRVEKSAKNARKNLNLVNKTSRQISSRSATTPHYSSTRELPPHHYPERAPAFSAHHATSSPRGSSVVITHKTTRQYDPSVVARLKEKLGLAHKVEEKEAVD